MSRDSVTQFSQDVGLLYNLGLKIVLVMGTSPQLDHAFSEAQIDWQLHHQFRITPTELIPLFQQTIGLLRSQLEATFS
ncbi:MAG TPA: hypothetical protein ENK73_06765 [Thiomicrospira sp.]|nr:hypothetical protein [Thiomicrospira sp.]